MQSYYSPGNSAGESERFSITPQDASVLKGYVEEFQKADTDSRKTILERAMGELYAMRPPNSTFDKKEAKRDMVFTITTLVLIVNLSNLLGGGRPEMHFTMRRRKRLPNLRRGIPGSPSKMQQPHYGKKLSIEEQEPYAEMAKEWSEDRPPRDIQAKMAQAALPWPDVRDFQTQLFKTCGMRSVVLVAYADKDGNPRAAMDDWNSVLDDGMSFSEFCPKWKDARVWLEWMKYCRKCLEPEHDQSSPTGRPKTVKKKPKVITDADGEPEIPSITLEDGYSAKAVQAALRDYCHAHILLYNIHESGFISGRKNATIPWSKLSSDPMAWIEEECFPLGFPWVDPSKLRLVQIFQLLDHWRQRQKEGLIPLIWNPSNEETEQTSTPDTGESSRLPLSNISRPDTFQTLPQRLRGTPIIPTPYNDSDVPELEHVRLKRVVKVTDKARNADTGRGSGGIDPAYLERDH
ncbi:hypothetical protein EDB84DRAFT_1437881 [Lactarius hengduanensis]|nr:hypothetical protein EDB84DRAFT_1437881 [Lactarius hengduanensis]